MALVYSQSCASITTISFHNIFIIPEETQYPFAVTPSYIQPSASSNLLFVSMGLSVLDIS